MNEFVTLFIMFQVLIIDALSPRVQLHPPVFFLKNWDFERVLYNFHFSKKELYKLGYKSHHDSIAVRAAEWITDTGYMFYY